MWKSHGNKPIETINEFLVLTLWKANTESKEHTYDINLSNANKTIRQNCRLSLDIS